MTAGCCDINNKESHGGCKKTLDKGEAACYSVLNTPESLSDMEVTS